MEISTLLIIKVFLTGVLISFCLTPLVKYLSFKVGAVDEPSERKVHKKIMPRLGGVAIFLAFIISLLIYLPFDELISLMGLIMGGLVILFVGIIDDIYNIRPIYKLLGQIIAALIFVAFGSQVIYLSAPFEGLIYLGVLSIPVTIFWLVGVSNAVNLIDGLDGLASGVTGIALFIFALVALKTGQPLIALVSLALLGGVIGFFPHNFHPAKIFLGDCGALFLGFVVAGISVMGLLKSVTLITFMIPVLILGVPIFDTCFAIVRRFKCHKPIFQADGDHLHHRLLRLGLSHKQTVLFIYAISAGLGLGAILFVTNGYY
ncbi:MraY family glycosyltransferase [Natranaerofaba carboxydovora]|uniref:MraY family glycosyltransferase n=1 Tax=Natranaerofaba carboxydovora TaxID=2742683 RepID=UPI001F147395|nr:MraY family glycosyltransferase [Natranaerofaba carboxydovora]UMZ75083.1 putative undecaprenyl-phosphate N-acetylglucosaminyl 1-phosphate transferase [Natranaerofaba carboxydovora]